MYDSSFNSKTLAREIRRSDFGKIPRLYTVPGYLDGVIADSYKRVIASLPTLKISITKIRGKNAYKIDDIEDDLIIRKINTNIKVLTGVSYEPNYASAAQLRPYEMRDLSALDENHKAKLVEVELSFNRVGTQQVRIRNRNMGYSDTVPIQEIGKLLKP